MQNEQYLEEKCDDLEEDKKELQMQLGNLSAQIEDSLRNNLELESYLENFEVSQSRFGDK